MGSFCPKEGALAHGPELLGPVCLFSIKFLLHTDSTALFCHFAVFNSDPWIRLVQVANYN